MAKLEFDAGGIVYRKTQGSQPKIVLILDSYNRWTFPKGHIEKGEKTEVAALREIAEETGVPQEKLRIIKLLKKVDYWFRLEGELIHKYVYFYLVESSEEKLSPQFSEIKDAKWIDIDEAFKKISYKDTTREIFEMARKSLLKE